jgi:hypothetical protein
MIICINQCRWIGEKNEQKGYCDYRYG